MDIQKLNANIKWQQLTAKEILKYQQQGEDVPSEYQQWAATINAVLNVPDEVTYEMTNGETDITALEESLGKDMIRTELQSPDQTENNIGNENDQTRDEAEFTAQAEENRPADRTPEERTPAAQDEIALADQAITTDPNEILKRKQRLGIPPLS